MVSLLWQNTNYNLKIPYVTNVYITEYDLSKANINALYSKEVIDKTLYDELYNAPREYREVFIGNMIKNNIIVYKAISDGIREAKQMLFEANDLQDSEILTIRNDAVFVMGNKDLKSEFGLYKFKKKNVYKLCINTSNKLQILYNYDIITGNDTIDVKGINDTILFRHSEYMIQFLCSTFFNILNNPIETALSEFNIFYHKYINRELPIEYYREFDQYSVISVIASGSMMNTKMYGFDNLDDNYIDSVDINCNLSLLRDIGYMISDMYMMKKK